MKQDTDLIVVSAPFQIYIAAHLLLVEARNKGLEVAKSVLIEDNVWLGSSTLLLPEVKASRNAVVGAGAVVTRSDQENAVLMGNPARVNRETDP